MEDFEYYIDEAYRQWTDFAEERQDCTLEDFVNFAKELAFHLINDNRTF